MIYFDNGATSYPKPKRVEEAVMKAFTRYGANPGRAGHKMSMETAVKIYECREAAAELFGAGAVEDVVFCSNATHAINLAIKGILRRGDHVIISDLEHNAVLRPIHTLAEAGVIEYSVATTFENDTQTLESFAGLIQPNTSLICCTHASNVFGIRLPIEQIGMLARSRNLLFLVDAAQTAGVLEIDVQQIGIDFLCAAGHKSLYGPTGTGLLVTPHGTALGTIIEGGTGSFSSEYAQPMVMPDRLESGTANVPGILGLGAGIEYVREKGLDTIYNHEMKIGKKIHSRLAEMPGIQLYTGFTLGRHLPVISFNIAGIGSEEVASDLSEKGFAMRAGLHCAPLAHTKMDTLDSGTVRISIGAFNTTSQAMELCDAIEKQVHKFYGGNKKKYCKRTCC